ncbi:MAG: Crp/Fnr family transcriptional regulator [Megasphaera sp.]|jgi:CRP-like cAMP-binding protein|nr:Crp/Fnr family transcriptional regulator [Megasphaera sp.]
MEQVLSIIKKTPLFQGMEERAIMTLLHEFGVHKQVYEKGDFIFFAGDDVHHIGIVLSGKLHIIQEDYWGNRNIIAPVGAGNMFGEAFACLPGVAATVSVAVMDKAAVLFIDMSHIMKHHADLTAAQETLTMNLLRIMAQKNFILTKKIRYISQRSTRQKLMIFLSDEARRYGSSEFTISFNRQQLADYLSIDRSAMSAELSKMKREGMLEYHKEHFVLKNTSS